MGKSFKPYFSWLSVSIAVAISLYVASLSESFFGLNNAHAAHLAFDSSAPLSLFGLTLFSSAFLHFRVQHLLVNLILFLILSVMIEKKVGSQKTCLLFLASHFIVLGALTLITQIQLINPSQYLGLSHIVFAFLSFFALVVRNKFLLLSGFCVVLYSLSSGAQFNQGLSHLLGLIAGVIVFFIFKKSKFISEQNA